MKSPKTNVLSLTFEAKLIPDNKKAHSTQKETEQRPRLNQKRNLMLITPSKMTDLIGIFMNKTTKYRHDNNFYIQP